jgi:4-hydroxybenzoate polyprenyltransferase
MKRYTHWPQVVLGAAFGWAVPMAFSAVTGTIPPLAWLLFLATLTWALIYDTEYAMVDREDDLRIGVKSTAILFGNYDRLIVGLLQLAMLGMLAAVGDMAGLGWLYFTALAGAAAMALRQQYLIRNRDPRGCFNAFLNNNGFGMLVFVGLAVDYLVG